MSTWVTENNIDWQLLSPAHRYLMRYPYSLTSLYRRIATELRHVLYFADWSEQSISGSLTPCWRREIAFYNHANPWEWATTWIPQTSDSNPTKQIQELGNQSIGDILFSDNSVQRSPLEFALLDSQHALNQHATKAIQCEPGARWFRRSTFFIKQQTIIIHETFFSDLIDTIAIAHKEQLDDQP